MSALDKSESISHIDDMNKPEKKKKQPRTQIAGVQMRRYFIPGRGTVEAESLEEAIKQPNQEEVEDGNN